MSALKFGDLKVGDIITILEWRELKGDNQRRRDWIGEILTITALSYPFISVRIDSRTIGRETVPIDTTECTLAPLTTEYVEAMTPKRCKACGQVIEETS